jgi:glutamine cyclotransferase
MRRPRLFRLLSIAAALVAVSALAAPVSGYKVVAKFPHSTANFTEGLFYADGLFYEGTGLVGHSAVIATSPRTGKVVRRVELPAPYFGEGVVDWGPNIYEWTWQTHLGIVYDRASFKPLKRFAYEGEGWGMTRNARQIITSDGTPTLRFRDPATFKVTRSLVVKDDGVPVQELNELEYVKGEILANVWMTDRIARISPVDGHVIGWIDLTGLLPAGQRVDENAVLNGIAYDAAKDRLFVTGKLWPAIFEIRITPAKP